jgi:GH24 family phage-related lysozyme (muramidase)
MTPSAKCYALTREFEGCRLKAYQDTGGVWTIGYGSTLMPDGDRVQTGDTITQAQADAMLQRGVRRFSGYVDNLLNVSGLTQGQYDALTDFCYNRGPGNMQKSRLFRLVKANPDDPRIPEAFGDRENIVDRKGQVQRGLVRRRQAEAALYAG